MKHQNGFTIIELLIVVVIAAVLAALGGPAMQDFIKNNRLQSKTHALMADIINARSEAVTRKKAVAMCGKASGSVSCGGNAKDWGNYGYLVFIDENTNSTYEAGTDTLLRTGEPAANTVRVAMTLIIDTTDYNLRLNPDGSTAEGGDTARFAICDDRPDSEGRGRRIEVPPHGRPKIVTGINDCTPA